MKIYVETMGDPSVGIWPVQVVIDWPLPLATEFGYGTTGEELELKKTLKEAFETLLDEPVGVRFEDRCPDCGRRMMRSIDHFWYCVNPDCICNVPADVD